MKKIAVVGAGFAGLSTCWHLSKQAECSIDLFDSQGIGSGASGVATGLLHPYPGEQGRRSFLADEAIAHTKELLFFSEQMLQTPVASFDGIMAVKGDGFEKNIVYGDVELVKDGRFLITSGITVYAGKYLEGLWRGLVKRGVCLHHQKIERLEDLQGYDHIVVATGHLSTHFFPSELMHFQKLKGQVITAMRNTTLPILEKSTVGKGYMARTEKKDFYHVGATYERTYSSEEVDLAFAKKELYPKISSFYPEVGKLDVVSCKAGVRFARRGHYYPLLAQMKKGVWLFTGSAPEGFFITGSSGKSCQKLFYKMTLTSFLGNLVFFPSQNRIFFSYWSYEQS